jgi:hypothetical protein
MADFERWNEKQGRVAPPREVIERQRIRAILGMEVSLLIFADFFCNV